MHLHKEAAIPFIESPFFLPPPTLHASETENVAPETMDEAMNDCVKGPGPSQLKNAPAVEPEGAIADIMDD